MIYSTRVLNFISVSTKDKRGLFVSKASVQIKENHHYVNFEAIRALLLLHESTAEQTLIESFDFEGKLFNFKVETE